MTIKEYLRQINKLELMIKCKKDDIQNLRDIATSITTTIKDVNVQTSGTTDKVGNCASKIADLIHELETDITNYMRLKSDIFNVMCKLEGNEFAVLYKHYIEHMTFDDIAYDLGYEVRQIYRIHGYALKKLQDVSKCHCMS